MGWVEKLNDRVAQSFIGKHFQLEGSGHRRERKNTRFTTEIRAGLTIFFAMVTSPKREREKGGMIHIVLSCRLILFL